MWRILLHMFTYSLLLFIVREDLGIVSYRVFRKSRIWSALYFAATWRKIDRPVLRHTCLSRERGGLKLAISTVIATCFGDASTPPALQRRQRPCVRIVQEQWAKRNIDDAAAAWLSVRERANACTNSRLYTGCPGERSPYIIQCLYFLEKRSWRQLFLLVRL